MVYCMETVSSKVPPDLKERIETYQEEHGLNRSQAVRRLIEEGIDSHENPHTITLPTMLVWVGSVLLATAYITVESGPVGPLGAAMALGGFVLASDRIKRLTRWFLNRDNSPDTE